MTPVIKIEDEMMPLTLAEDEEMTAEIDPITGHMSMETRYVFAQMTPFQMLTVPVTKPSQTEDEKKAERLAKLEAWKQKQAAEKDRKAKEADAAGGTRNLLAEIDKKAQESPVVASPISPSTPAADSGPASPAPYAGKFDPKAIAKKAAAASTGGSKLGADIALPQNAKSSATTKPNSIKSQADINLAPAKESTGKLCSL